MPEMGKPRHLTANNPFKNVSIKKKAIASNRRAPTKGELLNELSGKQNVAADGVKFVDGRKHGKLGKEGFLQLLTHQLQNQDPFKPMDQNKFAADLAQFSQLEQMTNMNKNIEKSMNLEPMKSKFFAASFLGRKVITAGATIKVNNINDKPLMSFKVPKEIAKGLIRIYDKKNQMIQQLDLAALPKGLHSVQWDGNQMDGTPAGKGLYRFEVRAYDDMNNNIPIKTKATGIVTSVQFENGETVLTVDGKKVFLRDVESFHVANGEKEMGPNLEGPNSNLPQELQDLVQNQATQINKKSAQNAYQKSQELAEY